jgi:hypothetical protein
MRVSFCRLTEINGMDIIVNPLTVRYLAPGSPGTTRICFDNNHIVSVRGSPREVQKKLCPETELMTFPEP